MANKFKEIFTRPISFLFACQNVYMVDMNILVAEEQKFQENGRENNRVFFLNNRLVLKISPTSQAPRENLKVMTLYKGFISELYMKEIRLK